MGFVGEQAHLLGVAQAGGMAGSPSTAAAAAAGTNGSAPLHPPLPQAELQGKAQAALELDAEQRRSGRQLAAKQRELEQQRQQHAAALDQLNANWLVLQQRAEQAAAAERGRLQVGPGAAAVTECRTDADLLSCLSAAEANRCLRTFPPLLRPP